MFIQMSSYVDELLNDFEIIESKPVKRLPYVPGARQHLLSSLTTDLDVLLLLVLSRLILGSDDATRHYVDGQTE